MWRKEGREDEFLFFIACTISSNYIKHSLKLRRLGSVGEYFCDFFFYFAMWISRALPLGMDRVNSPPCCDDNKTNNENVLISK